MAEVDWASRWTLCRIQDPISCHPIHPGGQRGWHSMTLVLSSGSVQVSPGRGWGIPPVPSLLETPQ